jgi:4-amino-4-deoxy-L-arabinose transferase-like glycosyltransferase
MMRRFGLAVILVVYMVVGALYAVKTPPWEAPDEPAHYNYIAYLAEHGRFPVLQRGDYPHKYLEEIKAAQFPPEMSIAPIRYEFHQPPLYYLLAAPIYLATKPLALAQQVVALRLFSLLQGGALLIVSYLVVREVFPESEFLPLASVAFIATVPMHIAMSAAINNDTLGELILALILWQCLLAMREGLRGERTLSLGLLLALALLTKTTIYVPAIASTLVAAFYLRRRGEAIFRHLGLILGMGLALSAWWFLRNGLVYGGFDIFGWARHDTIVEGQPTTAEWVAGYGAGKVVEDFFVISFKSFWAIFGWMGVLVDSRIYDLLFLVSLAVLLGVGIYVNRLTRGSEILTAPQRGALSISLLLLLLMAASHLWYNVKFVQPQGRYLFPALIPIGFFFALGLREWARILVRLISLLLPLHKARLEPAAERAVLALFYLGFLTLDLVCLYKFIVPHFAL